jgi:hypothetical protein
MVRRSLDRALADRIRSPQGFGADISRHHDQSTVGVGLGGRPTRLARKRRQTQALRNSFRSPLPESSEELPHVGDEEVRPLHGREVTATIELRPPHDVVIAFGEPAN